MTRFDQFSDAELDLLAEAFGSAFGEGASGPDGPLAHELRDEFRSRGRDMPSDGWHPNVRKPPEEWGAEW